MVKKYADLYLEARQTLIDAGEIPREAGVLARQLLAFLSGKSHAQLIADSEKYAQDDVINAMNAAVRRLAAGEPMAYIMGEWEFYGLNLIVTPDVLIPRDDTVALAEIAINQALFLEEKPRILDLCTGSGCIGLAIASRVKDAKVTLADLSREALAVAKKNVTMHKMTGRVSCVHVDALQEPPAFLGQFDMIVSNPPYITTGEMGELERSVADYEPHLALWGGEDGLDFYRSIAEKYRKCLKPGGYLCFEYGDTQGDDVCAILTENGFTIRDRVRDYNDRERAVIAQYCRED
ncbi:MAG: peptide chain release factor N(5)-glutamine methyltransferase [Oscillospiraceae bacterium]|nr:peptide chain release factor N(5)-glutamine methyltransferase [Oscillospiraceae bacterium]